MQRQTHPARQSLLLPWLMIALFTLSLLLPLWRGESPIDLGLDLSGGVIVTYQPDFDSRLEAFAGVPEDEILTLVKETLSSRLIRSLATVPDVVIRDDQRIVVSLPGDQDYRQVLETVGRTFSLTFRLINDRVAGPAPERELFAYQGSYLELAEPEFSGAMLDERHIRVETVADDRAAAGWPAALVSFRFLPPHDEAFAAFTRANVGRELAIVLDDEVEWAGTIESAIAGSGVLRGGYDVREATQVATMLRAGTLPISLDFESLSAVGPSLGQEVQALGKKALLLAVGLLGGLVILAYMHRGGLLVCGLLALGCLLLAIAGLAAVFDLTLDTVGIAGLILSVGMGMDAFILVFEALDAELRATTPRQLSGRRDAVVRRLYSFAAEGHTLFHANTTTLIVILLLLTSERLRSFALFMGVGILASLLTIGVTRAMLRRTGGLLRGAGPNLLAPLRSRRLGLFRLRKVYAAFVLTAVSATGCLLLGGSPGGPLLELGADFKPGIQVTLTSAERQLVEAAVGDFESLFTDVDIRLQRLGSSDAGRFLITLGAVLDGSAVDSDSAPQGPDAGVIRARDLEAAFAIPGLEIESISSIDSRVSFERLSRGLMVLLASFLCLALYLVVLQEPIDRFFARSGRPPVTSSTRTLVFCGILLAVVVDVALMLAGAALLRIPIGLPVLAAMLTIIGYSINDSVVLWSHVLGRRSASGQAGDCASAFEQVSRGVDRIASRALLTSLSTMVPAWSILVLGLEPLADFARMILIGTVAGTFSSLFIVGTFAARALERRQPVKVAASLPV